VTIRSMFVLALLSTAMCGASPANDRAVSTIHVLTIGCLDDRGTLPKLRVLRMNDWTFSHMFLDGPTSLAGPATSNPRILSRGIYDFKVVLPTGNYEFYASTKLCSGQAMAIMLPGRRRSITLSLGQGGSLYDHDHAAMAGTIDMPGAQLELTSADGPGARRIPSIEGQAFYFDSLRRIRWLLNVHVGSRVAEFPIDLSSLHSGDYATAALSSSDIISRLRYRGALFSDPVDIALDRGVVWYANPGRHTVGYVGRTGRHAAFALPPDWLPATVRADGAGGAWFSEWGPARLGHVDRDGAFSQHDFATKDDKEWQAFQILASGANVYALAWNSRTAYRLRPGLEPQPFPIPEDAAAYNAGLDGSGTLWLDLERTEQAARLDETGFQLLPAPAAEITKDIRSSKDIFFAVPSRYARGNASGITAVPERASASVVASDRFGKADFNSGYTAIRDDDRLGVWLSDCDHSIVFHLRASKVVQKRMLAQAECPYEMAADGMGGIWYAAVAKSMVAHLRRDGNTLRFPLPRTNVLPQALRVDEAGRLWFVEPGANKIAYLSSGHFTEIDLGNPGATPNFTIVP